MYHPDTYKAAAESLREKCGKSANKMYTSIVRGWKIGLKCFTFSNLKCYTDRVANHREMLLSCNNETMNEKILHRTFKENFINSVLDR